MTVPAPLIAGPLDGSEFLWVLQAKQKRLLLITGLLGSITTQIATLMAEIAVLQTEADGSVASIKVVQTSLASLSAQLGADEKTLASLGSSVSGLSNASNTLSTALAALVTRVAALEGKPSPVQHFTAAVSVPAILVAGQKIVTMTVTGLKAGDLLAVQPTTAMPIGMDLVSARAPADNTLEVAFDALVAITGTTPLTLNIGALR